MYVCVVKFEIKLADWHFLFVKLKPSFTFINDSHYFVLRYKSDSDHVCMQTFTILFI